MIWWSSTHLTQHGRITVGGGIALVILKNRNTSHFSLFCCVGVLFSIYFLHVKQNKPGGMADWIVCPINYYTADFTSEKKPFKCWLSHHNITIMIIIFISLSFCFTNFYGFQLSLSLFVFFLLRKIYRIHLLIIFIHSSSSACFLFSGVSIPLNKLHKVQMS